MAKTWLPAKTTLDSWYEKKNIHAIEGPICCSGRHPGYGNSTAEVMIIGMSPAVDEMETKRPLTGMSGSVLNSMLEACGWGREKVYCTDMVCEWKVNVTKEDYLICRPRLIDEIKLIKPKLIIIMGHIPVQFITGRKVKPSRGSVVWYDEFNAYVMPTYHPASVFHGMSGDGSYEDSMNMGLDLARDFRKIPKIISTWPSNGNELLNIKYTIISSKEQAQSVLDSLDPNIPVALDVETSNKDVEEISIFDDRLLCFAISDARNTWVFPVQFSNGLRWPREIRWIFHNAMFDTQVVRRHIRDHEDKEVILPVWSDTMLRSYSLEERSGYHGLKPLSREYNGVGWWEEVKKGSRVDELDEDTLYEYNAMDAYQTAILDPKLLEMQIEDGVLGFYERILIPAVNTFRDIQFRGIRIDKDLIGSLMVEWYGIYQERHKELLEMANREGWQGNINLNSPKQLADFLYDILGIPLVNNSRSTNADILKSLKDAHPFIEKLLSFRHLDHMMRLYIIGILNKIKFDSLIHPNIAFHRTRTGRPAYTDPPVQTIPHDFESDEYDLEYWKLKSLFVPVNPDNIIIEADYSKAEIWMAYYYSGDPNLYNDLISGDYHTHTGSVVLKKPIDQITKYDRYSMKRVTFGIMYGQLYKGLAKILKIPEPECAEMIDNWLKHNSGYANMYRTIPKILVRDGELVSKTGRKRRFLILNDYANRRIINQALNFFIQATTSDVLLEAVIEMHPKLEALDAHVLLTVHDSIAVECPKDKIGEVIEIMHSTMTRPKIDGIGRMPIDVKIGTSLGGGKAVHSCEEKDGCLDNNFDDSIFSANIPNSFSLV